MILKDSLTLRQRQVDKVDLRKALESCREGNSIKVISETLFNVTAMASRDRGEEGKSDLRNAL